MLRRVAKISKHFQGSPICVGDFKRMFDLPDLSVLGYELNAFLSAARSVTFLLQKEFAVVDGFEAWWLAERSKLGADDAARFFLELRNFSQKEARVSVVGMSDQNRKWRYMFAGTAERVPVNREFCPEARE